MGVSTSLDTNGEIEWLKATDCGLLPIVTLERDKWLVRLDQGSRLRPKPLGASKSGIPGQTRDDESEERPETNDGNVCPGEGRGPGRQSA